MCRIISLLILIVVNHLIKLLSKYLCGCKLNNIFYTTSVSGPYISSLYSSSPPPMTGCEPFFRTDEDTYCMARRHCRIPQGRSFYTYTKITVDKIIECIYYGSVCMFLREEKEGKMERRRRKGRRRHNML